MGDSLLEIKIYHNNKKSLATEKPSPLISRIIANDTNQKGKNNQWIGQGRSPYIFTGLLSPSMADNICITLAPISVIRG
jgi:hypothetical protein